MTKRTTRRIAHWMRTLADRLDHRGAPKCIGWTFTFEHKRGLVFREDGKGCPLWYYGDDNYQRAHTEADTDHAIVDWNSRPLRAHIPADSGPLHAHEVTPDDAALIRVMAGARFGPDARVTLPSGRTITGTEMQQWLDTNEGRRS